MTIYFLISIFIFAATLVLVLKNPKHVGVGYWTLIGAGLNYFLGIITLSDVLEVWGIVWNATFTFVAIIIISLIFDEAGIFEYAAIRISRLAKGNGVLLFVFIVILGAMISAIFANDGTALLLTPIVYSMLYRLKLEKKYIIPFIMATGFIADSASLPLPVSNLVNIVSLTYFKLNFIGYSKIMIFPDIISIVASLSFLLLFYRRSIPRSYDWIALGDPKSVIREPKIFKAALPVIVILIVAYAVGSVYSVSIAFIASAGAIFLLLLTKFESNIDIPKILKEAPWQIVIFSFGMYLIVFGMGHEGLTDIIAMIIADILRFPGPIPAIFTGYFFGTMAAGMNNMPSVLIGALSISHITSYPNFLIYTNVIGNDIGPKFTPIGSLATMLWIYTLQRKGGIDISYRYYMKVGFLIALPVLTLTLLALWAVMII